MILGRQRKTLDGGGEFLDLGGRGGGTDGCAARRGRAECQAGDGSTPPMELRPDFLDVFFAQSPFLAQGPLWK